MKHVTKKSSKNNHTFFVINLTSYNENKYIKKNYLEKTHKLSFLAILNNIGVLEFVE